MNKHIASPAALALAIGASLALATPAAAQPTSPPSFGAGELVEAEDFVVESNPGSDLEVRVMGTPDGGEKVGFLRNGSWIGFPGFDFGVEGGQSVTMSYSRGIAGSGSVFVSVDAPDGPLLATFGLPSTGGWNEFETISFDSLLETELGGSVTGERDLFIQFVNPSGGYVADIDSFTIAAG
ncbi:MAG: carbohydrate-binding protein [Actinomycetota bacterium]